MCCGAQHCASPCPRTSGKDTDLLHGCLSRGAHHRKLGSQVVGPGRDGLRAAVVPPSPCGEVRCAMQVCPRAGAVSCSPNTLAMKRNSPAVRARAAGWNEQPARHPLLRQDKCPAPGSRAGCGGKGATHKGGSPLSPHRAVRWGHVSCPLGCCRGATQLLLTQGAGLAHRLQNGKSACAVPTPRPGAS